MKKYADKIFIVYVIITVILIFVEAPFMIDAHRARKKYWNEDAQKRKYETYQLLKKEFEAKDKEEP